jgi:hypothetical protein
LLPADYAILHLVSIPAYLEVLLIKISLKGLETWLKPQSEALSSNSRTAKKKKFPLTKSGHPEPSPSSAAGQESVSLASRPKPLKFIEHLLRQKPHQYSHAFFASSYLR